MLHQQCLSAFQAAQCIKSTVEGMFCNSAATKLPVVTMKTLQSELMMSSY